MLLQVLEVALNPIWLLFGFGFLLTYLLRHRLYLYAMAGEPRGGKREHIFILQNLEDVDLGVQLELALSTTSDAGRIRKITLYAGKQGPPERTFTPAGRERRALTVLGMAALDTWKIVCKTDDEAERVRLVVRGWDVRRNQPRSWLPAISGNGISITSTAAGVQRELTRPANRVAWLCLAMVLLVYSSVTHWLSHIAPVVVPFAIMRRLSAHIVSLIPPLDWRVDAPILLALLVIGGLGVLTTMRRAGIPIPLGYLGDKRLDAVFREFGEASDPIQSGAAVDSVPQGACPPQAPPGAEKPDPP